MKNQKTLKQKFTVVFQRQQKYDKNFWVELGSCLLFFILLLLVEKLEIILNKHKEWHWFLCSLFLFNFINKNVFFN